MSDALSEHQPLLWALAYRMTGSAADADDVVQDTFTRALSHQPDASRPLRPWLVRVTMNLARDALRRRRRRDYTGPWLPEAIDTEREPPALTPTPAARYELLESAGYAFLTALEALTPSQRAVLVLRDVFDWSLQETADALGISLANVKTTHHRARKAMAAYDAAPAKPSAELSDKNRAALLGLFAALGQEDHETLQRLVADEVRALSDGGGEFFAAIKPVFGRAKVTKLFKGLLALRGVPQKVELRTINGLPALYCEHSADEPGYAPRWLIRVDLDPAGRINAVHSLLAAQKLRRIPAAE